MGLFVDKGSGSGIFPDPGDPKRPDPTGSGSATLMWRTVKEGSFELRKQRTIFLSEVNRTI